MNYKTIIRNLTLEEKCALLSGATQFGSRGIPRLGIPSILFSDGPNGVRKQAGAADHLGLNPSEPATCFPTSATSACSWDEALLEEIGQALGREAAAHGVNVLLGPGLNIKRNPLCGRNFEYFSEDPYLSGKLAAAYVRGVESTGISACPKHFAVNSQETRRMASDSIVDDRTLHEIYLTGFEIAVKEGKPGFVMSSYNLVNGVYANENELLLNDVLRRQWGFPGAVVTDWGGNNDHALGVKAGSNVQMPAPGGDAVRQLLKAVKDGTLSEKDIDLRLAELLPLVDRCSNAVKKAPKQIDEKAHHALVRRAASQSMVLLKNDENILPLKKDTAVAVIGDFAKNPRYQGAGSSAVNATQVDNFMDLASAEMNIIGYAQGFLRDGAANEHLQQEAVQLAAQADVALVFIGLSDIAESEGRDRDNMKLAQSQIDLLQAVSKVNPNVVAVLICGSPVESDWAVNCKGLVYAALGGQAAAGAIVDILTGACNPCGKLTETWPIHYEDVPSAANFAGAGRYVQYREGPYVGYRYFEAFHKNVAFPFGYGLSYTTFEYDNLKLEKNAVTFTVKNSGERAGSEIAQLYIDRPDDTVLIGGKRELKGFAKVTLAPGESKTVTIALDDKAFRFWNTDRGCWSMESGTYTVCVGASVRDIRLSGTLEVTGEKAVSDMREKLPSYVSGNLCDVPDAEFEALLGRPVPDRNRKPEINRNITMGELNHSRSIIGWLVWLVLTLLLKQSIKRGKPDLNILFNYNMPLRAMAGMTGGMISMGMVDALVLEFKGFWIVGLLLFLFEAAKNLILNAGFEKRMKGSKTNGK